MNPPALILRTAMLLLLMVYNAKMSIITTKQDIEVGNELLLFCKAGGEGEITWQKDGEGIIDEDKVTTMDETSSKLLIKKATLQDAGTYTCMCEFESGHKDNFMVQVYVYEGPSFSQTTLYHEFLEGTDGMVPCLATGKPAVDVVWLRDKQTFSSDGRLSDNTLLMKKVRREDAGTYVCRAQIRGRPIYKELSVSVVVNDPPTVRLKEEEKKVMAGSETNVSLLCLVDGIPKPNITWTTQL
uniref:Ig-like domain-containing protein n=1 Tax=Mola mola TaxID=94237 RepID=A0A3Q3WLZ6_MOLML